jgi:cytosine/uracil/thiamine/allantoin permease
MATNSLLTLLAHAMVSLPLVLSILFAVLFCGVYLVLLVVNAVVALVNGYQQRAPRLLVSRRAMAIVSCLIAMLVCSWFLYNIDGSNT